jgi:hypothetical protein
MVRYGFAQAQISEEQRGLNAFTNQIGTTTVKARRTLRSAMPTR